MSTLLIATGSHSFKLGFSSGGETPSALLLHQPIEDFSLSSSFLEQGEFLAACGDSEGGEPLGSRLGVSPGGAFLLTQHMDFEFRKEAFVSRAFEQFFERMGFERGNLPLQPICDFAALGGEKSVLMVDSGHESTYVTPVSGGYILADSVQRSALGGRAIGEGLERLMRFSGCSRPLSPYETHLMKKKYLRIAPDRKLRGVLAGEGGFYRSCILPSGERLALNEEVFELGELLFGPREFGLDGQGLAEKLLASVRNSPIDLRLELMDNVVVFGGNSCLANFELRLQREFERLWHGPTSEAKIAASPICFGKSGNKEFHTYRGLFCLAQVAKEKDLVTKKEYREFGAVQIYLRKNINKLSF